MILSISFSAVPNPPHIDRSRAIIDRIDDAVIASPYAPQVLFAFQFFAPNGSRLRGELHDLWKNAFDDTCRKALKFLSGGACEDDCIVSHAAYRLE
jgi:hypothetical protein